MRFLLRALRGAVLALVCLALVGAGVWRYIEAGAETDDKPAWGRGGGGGERTYVVNIETLEAIDATPVQTAFGDIRAARSIDIRTGTAGRLIFVSPEMIEGGTVRRGAVLARVDPAAGNNRTADAEAALDDRRAALDDAERTLVTAQAEFEAAQRQEALRRDAYDRQATLAQRGFAARSAVEAAELSLAAAAQSTLARRQAISGARARLAQAKVAMERARLTLEDTRRNAAEAVITAPFDGILDEVGVNEGRLLSTNEKLARLTDQTSLEARFTVSSEDFTRLTDDRGALLSRPVRVAGRFGEAGIGAEGRLDRVAATVEAGRGGRVLFARLTSVRGLRPGDFVTLEIDESVLSSVARVPATAISEDGRLLLVGEDGRLSEITARVVRREGNGVLLADAPFGARFVTERQPQLGPGVQVRGPGDPPPGRGAGGRPGAEGRPGGGERPGGGNRPEGAAGRPDNAGNRGEGRPAGTDDKPAPERSGASSS